MDGSERIKVQLIQFFDPSLPFPGIEAATIWFQYIYETYLPPFDSYVKGMDEAVVGFWSYMSRCQLFKG